MAVDEHSGEEPVHDPAKRAGDATGVELLGESGVRAAGRPLRLAFVGQAVERKGLPVLLRAFEALRQHIPVELVLVGAGPDDIAPLMLDPTGVRALGKVSDERKHAALAGADLLVAPSLGGESFGMVLTEGFAAGTPVVASDIAGYRIEVHVNPAFVRANDVLTLTGDNTRLAGAIGTIDVLPLVETLRWMFKA